MVEVSPSKPTGALVWLAQGLLYGFFALLIGVFSQWPTYQHLAADQSLIKLSFSHHGKHVSACRPTSAAELAKLPPNMRAPTQCPRERAPVLVELDIDYRRLAKEVGVPGYTRVPTVGTHPSFIAGLANLHEAIPTAGTRAGGGTAVRVRGVPVVASLA